MCLILSNVKFCNLQVESESYEEEAEESVLPQQAATAEEPSAEVQAGPSSSVAVRRSGRQQAMSKARQLHRSLYASDGSSSDEEPQAKKPRAPFMLKKKKHLTGKQAKKAAQVHASNTFFNC